MQACNAQAVVTGLAVIHECQAPDTKLLIVEQLEPMRIQPWRIWSFGFSRHRDRFPSPIPHTGVPVRGG